MADGDEIVPPDEGRGSVAILVIHGMGEQNPYEALDAFGRGFTEYFAERGHRPSVRAERINHGTWREATVHVELGRPTEGGLRRLTVHEFYWAPYTKGKITYGGVIAWLARTSLTPLRFLSGNLQALIGVNQGATWWTKLGLFSREILRIDVGPVILLLLLVAGIAILVSSANGLWEIAPRFWATVTADRYPVLTAMTAMFVAMAIGLAFFIVREAQQHFRRKDPSIRPAADRTWLVLASVFLAGSLLATWLSASLTDGSIQTYFSLMISRFTVTFVIGAAILLFVRYVVIEYVGDVAVYVTADQKAKSFEARSAILKESTAALGRLLLMARRHHERVIVAGHSLGSAIAYDTINRLLSQVWSTPAPTVEPSNLALDKKDLEKIAALVTFGSPLDKIFYFFREEVDSEQAIRAQILSFLHSFRRSRSGRNYGIYQFTNGEPDRAGGDSYDYPKLRPDFQWLNVWSPMDPFSGPLRFYELEEDDRLRRWYWLWGVCHVQYWHDPKFYRFVANKLLR